MLRYFAMVGLGVALGGCRETLPPVEKPVFKELTQADVTATTKKLAELRGLRLRENPKVLLLRRDQYEKEIEQTHDTKAPVAGPGDVLPALLGLLGPSKERKARPSEAESAKEHVRGFYEHSDKTIRMPNSTPKSRSEDQQQRAVLAHELHHAMQFQSFKEPVLDSADAVMAWKSLVEGDAQVAQLLHTADREKLPISGVLRRARYDVLKPAQVSPLASPIGSTPWEALPLTSQTLREFPYREGLAFVVDLYRAGGFALVDKAYGQPPTNTEHVLHPDKYLAGEKPRPIADLEPPAHWKATGSTSLGELRIRMFLEPCLGKPRAAAAAAGWHGDRAFVLEGEKAWQLGWVSAWDSEADAIEQQDALARMGPCLPESDEAGKQIAVPFTIRRQGTLVAFVRGGEPAERETMVERLLALPGQAPLPTPVSTAKVPPLHEPPELAGGALEADVYRNDFFGMTAATSVFDATLDAAGSRLQLLDVKARRLRAGGRMGFSIEISTPERLSEIFAEWEERVVGYMARDGYETTRYEEQRTIRTALGVGYERSWTQRRGVLAYRVTIIPICGGTGHIALETVFSTNPGRELMDYWVQSFRWTAPTKRPPVCEYLDPESQSK